MLVSILNPIFVIVFLGVIVALRKRSAFAFVLFFILYAVSITPVADRFISGLESSCPHLVKGDNINTVVILSGGIYERSDAISSLGCSSLKRLLCGIKLCSDKRSCEIYLSGGSILGNKKEADILFDVAKDFSKANIIVERESRFTEENAEKLSKLVAGKPFYLVTSAWHMKRALFLFRQKGLSPVPYCCDYLKEKRYVFLDYFPHYRNIKKTFLALHEYAALLYYRFKFSFKKKITSYHNKGKDNKK